MRSHRINIRIVTRAIIPTQVSILDEFIVCKVFANIIYSYSKKIFSQIILRKSQNKQTVLWKQPTK